MKWTPWCGLTVVPTHDCIITLHKISSGMKVSCQSIHTILTQSSCSSDFYRPALAFPVLEGLNTCGIIQCVISGLVGSDNVSETHPWCCVSQEFISSDEWVVPHCEHVCVGHSVVSSSFDAMDCSPPGSSSWNSLGKTTRVGSHSLFRGSSWPRDPAQVACTAGRLFTIWATEKPMPLYGYTIIWFERSNQWNCFLCERVFFFISMSIIDIRLSGFSKFA